MSNKVTEKATNPSEETSEEETSTTESSDEEVVENVCDRCDFVGKTAAGLKNHKTKKHKFGVLKG